MIRFLIVSGSIAALLGVALGAFGAHGLAASMPARMMAIYQTAVQYQLIHAVALVSIGIGARSLPGSAMIKAAGLVMLIGIVLFSGSLYVLALTDLRWVGAITPLGGMAMIAGWLLLALAVLRTRI